MISTKRAAALLSGLLLVACGDDGGTGAGGSGSGGTPAGGNGTGGNGMGGNATGGAPAGGANPGGSTADGGQNAGGAGGGVGGMGTGGQGGAFAGGCVDLVGSCLASNKNCSDYGVGGPGQTECEAATFVWSTQSCVDRPDADVGAGCLGIGAYCGIAWYWTGFSAGYPGFQATCENSGQTWITL